MLHGIDVREVRGRRNVALQFDTEESIDGERKQAQSSKENGNRMTLIHRIRKTQLQFSKRLKSKECLRNLTFSRYIEPKKERRRQRVTYITNLWE